MRKNEIKKTVEEIIGVEYIAEDGTVFNTVEECEKYEKSALFVVSNKLKRLTTKETYINDFNDEGSCDCELEIFDIQTEEDLNNLRRYLYLKAITNGATEKGIKDAFTSDDGKRENFVFDNVTIGHEVLVFWSYDKDWFWVYKDGSLNGYFESLKERYDKIVTPKDDKQV